MFNVIDCDGVVFATEATHGEARTRALALSAAMPGMVFMVEAAE